VQMILSEKHVVVRLLCVQDELIDGLSTSDKLWLFSHVPLTVIKPGSCHSILMQLLTDECCAAIERCSVSANTFTIAQLLQLVCFVFGMLGFLCKFGFLFIKVLFNRMS